MRATLPFLLTAFLLPAQHAAAQSFTSYFTGDSADVSPSTTPGEVLMGGATESDQAMRWFLNRAGGGDVVVIRASGSDGYNDYLYSQLGVTVNSVESIVFNDASAAADPYVRTQLANAEAIWIAGGDQWDYVSYWKGTGIDSILNHHVNVKHAPIGGTSAGMAILGEAYNSAQNGSVTSAAALANPFDAEVTIGNNDFLHLPYLQHVVTDTHYDNPDRRGRHFVFMARMMGGSGDTVRGIACEEYTAVCIDANGLARVFGDYPASADQAYFLQANCALPNNPETLQAGQPITWNRGGMAVKAYRVFGDTSGTFSFSLTDWKTGNGGYWEDWSASGGVFNVSTGAAAPDCPTAVANIGGASDQLRIFPNPGNDATLECPSGGLLQVYDAQARLVATIPLTAGSTTLQAGNWKPGVYLFRITDHKGDTQSQRWTKE